MTDKNALHGSGKTLHIIVYFLCFSISVYSGTYLNSCMNLVVYYRTNVVPICKFLNSSTFASIVPSMRWYSQNACANSVQPLLAGSGWFAQKQSHHKLAMPLSCRVAMLRPSLSVHFTSSSLLLIPRNQSSASIGSSAWIRCHYISNLLQDTGLLSYSCC